MGYSSLTYVGLFSTLIVVGLVYWAARRGVLSYLRYKLFPPPPPPVRRPPTGGSSRGQEESP